MIYRGQTLLSLMIALSLSSFLLLAIIAFYHQTQRQNQEILLRLELQEELQHVLQLMAKDLRRAGLRAVSDNVLHSNLPLFEQDDGSALTLQQMDNQAPNSCVLFFYDLDLNGCIGTKFKGGICTEGERNATKEIERELFGYRLNNQMIETRLTYKNAVNQSCEKLQCQRYLQQTACNEGGWTDLLDDKKYAVSRLTFSWLADRKGLEVTLAGNLVKHQSITYQTSAVIPLLNMEVP